MKKTKTNIFSEDRLVFKDPKDAKVEDAIASDLDKKGDATEVKEKSQDKRKEEKNKVDRRALKRAVDAKSATGNLDIWDISARRRSMPEINADAWGVSSKEKLATLRQNWIDLQIFKAGDAFYEDMFKELAKCSDEKFLGKLKSDDERIAYRNPLKNMDKVRKHCSENFRDKVNFFKAVKKIVVDQDIAQKHTEELLQNRTKEPITSAIGDGVRSNISAIKEAVSNGDWATVGAYAVGAYGIYKLFNMLPASAGENGKGSFFNKAFFGKLIFGGVALYTVDKVAKNAGFNIAEKMGFVDHFDSLKDTPLVSFGDYQIPGGKKVDARVLRDTAFVNMGDLHTQYENKVAGVPGFIDPNQFPSVYSGKFIGMHPEDLKTDKSVRGKLSEYKRVGENLYLIAKSLEYAYEKAEMNKRGGMSYADAVQNDPVLRNSTVFDFLVQLQQHALNTRESLSIVGTKGAEKVRKRLSEVLKVAHDVKGELKPGYFQATVKGYPVVIARDSNGKNLVVFARSDYELAAGTPDKSSAMAKIPFEGKAGDAAKTLNLLIDDRMSKLVDVFSEGAKGEAKFDKTKLNYDKGKWYAEVTYAAGNLLSKAPDPVKVVVSAGLTGTALSVTTLGGKNLVTLDSVGGAGIGYGELVLKEMLGQKALGTDFSALKLLGENALHYVDRDPSDKKFAFRIDGVTIDGEDEFEVEVEGTASILAYKLASGLETKLIANDVFRMKIAEAAGKDDALNKPIAQFKGLLVNAPESYVMNLITSIPSWVKEFTIANPVAGFKGRHFTGAIAKSYSEALVDAQKQAAIYRMADSIRDAGSFSKISGRVGAVRQKAIDDLNDLVRDFGLEVARKVDKNKDYKADEFDSKVLDKLSTIGLQSNDYKIWYKNFLGRLVARFGGDEEKIAACLRVYAYHTTEADDPKQDGADLQAPKHLKAGGPVNPAWQKAELFKKNAAKCEHVSQQIFLRLDTLGDRSIPGPGGDWGIKSSPSLVKLEYNDTTPRLKEFKDYIEFDEYLRKRKAGEVVDQTTVMLPKHDCMLEFIEDSEEANLYKKLSSVGTVKEVGNMELDHINTSMTEVERKFSRLMLNALEKLKKGNGKYIGNKFDELSSMFSIRSNDKISLSGNSVKIEYKYLGSANPDSRDFSDEIEALQTEFTAYKGTLTGKVQEDMIKARVAKIVEERIIGNSDKYFEKGSLKKSLSEIWHDIKSYILSSDI